MKKLKLNILTVLTIFVVSSIFYSCSGEDVSTEIELTNKFGEITVTQAKNNSLTEKILNYNSKNLLSTSARSLSEFDFDNPTLISIGNSNITAISASELNSETNIEREMSFILDVNGEITKSFTTEVNHINDYQKEIKYYDTNGVLLNHFIIDAQEDTVNFITINSNRNSNTLNRSGGCGQAVIDCMGDKYTENGWDSVFLSIATAFLPEVAVGVAVICLYESDECA